MLVQLKSLLSLELLRLFHAASVFLVTAGVLVWAVTLWRAGSISTGDVVLTTTLGITLLGASRDLAMAMVDLFQHFAKLGEAVKELGLPHEMVDAPDAKPAFNLGGSVKFRERLVQLSERRARAAGLQPGHPQRPDGRPCWQIGRRQIDDPGLAAAAL